MTKQPERGRWLSPLTWLEASVGFYSEIRGEKIIGGMEKTPNTSVLISGSYDCVSSIHMCVCLAMCVAVGRHIAHATWVAPCWGSRMP